MTNHEWIRRIVDCFAGKEAIILADEDFVADSTYDFGEEIPPTPRPLRIAADTLYFRFFGKPKNEVVQPGTNLQGYVPQYSVPSIACEEFLAESDTNIDHNATWEKFHRVLWEELNLRFPDISFALSSVSWTDFHGWIWRGGETNASVEDRDNVPTFDRLLEALRQRKSEWLVVE